MVNKIGFAQVTQNSSSIPAAMMEGERESLVAISSVVPGLAPRVLLFGDTETLGGSWMLMNYIEMVNPEDNESMQMIARDVANLHKQSLGRRNRCGFHVATYHGKLKQFCDWEERWDVFYARALSESFRLERSVHQPDTAFADMAERLVDNVIPRLLGGLKSVSLSSPFGLSLIHGDLWKLNCAMDLKDRQTILYDPCCFWGHNECLLFPNLES